MTQIAQRRWGISGFVLKWIAMITMVIDHTGMALFPQNIGFRIVGRLAFPIYCFLLVEGAIHTSNRKRYLTRLFLFALISELPFDLVLTGELVYWQAQNVFFTLFLGLLAVVILQTQINKVYSVICAVGIIFVAEFIHADYGGGGIFLILLFYAFRSQWLPLLASFSVATVWIYGGIQNFAIFSLAPIFCYNGKPGPKMKYFFYIFYPAHLLLLYWLRFRM